MEYTTIDIQVTLTVNVGKLYARGYSISAPDVTVSPRPDIQFTLCTTTRRDLSGGYGRLYNFYAVMDSRNLAPEGWRVAGKLWSTEYIHMSNAFASNFGAAFRIDSGLLKSSRTYPTDPPRWDAPNYGNQSGDLPGNNTGFSALPGGLRTVSGAFDRLGQAAFFWAAYHPDDMDAMSLWSAYPYTYWYRNMGQGLPAVPPDNQWIWNYGCSLRLVMEDPDLWEEGMKVTDADGNVYDTVRVLAKHPSSGEEYYQVWTVQNLATTHFRNGDPVPIIEGDQDWENATGAACCAYNNDESLAIDETMPTISGFRLSLRYEENILAIGNDLLEDRDTGFLIVERRLL